VLLERRLDVLLRVTGAGQAVDQLAALEHEQRRDAADAVAAGHGRVLVDVQLADDGLARELRRHLIDRRRDHAARPAPFGPEVDQDGGVRLEHGLIEIAVGEGLHVFGCHVGSAPCLDGASSRSGRVASPIFRQFTKYLSVVKPGRAPARTALSPLNYRLAARRRPVRAIAAS